MEPEKPKRNAKLARSRLLREAEKLFVKKGYHAVSVDEIAVKTKLNKRMIYVYFGSKEKLYTEVLKTNFAKIEELDIPEQQNEGDYFERLSGLMHQYFFFLSRNPNFVRLLAWEILLADKRSLKRLAQYAFGGITRLRDTLEEGINRGILREDIRLHSLSFAVISLFYNFFSMRPLAQEFWNRDLENDEALHKMLRQLTTLFMEGAINRPR